MKKHQFMVRQILCMLRLLTALFVIALNNISDAYANTKISDMGAYKLNQSLILNIENAGSNYFFNDYSLGNLQYLAKTTDGLYDLYILSYGTGIHNGMIGYYASSDGFIEKVAVSWDLRDKIAQDASMRISTALLATIGMNIQEIDILYRSLAVGHFPISVWCTSISRRIFLNLELDNDGIVRFIYTAGK